jgi:hypothetical protein
MAWAPAYCTAAQLKADLRIPAADTVDDTQLDLAIAAASRAIDQATNRQFGQVSPVEARIYTARFDRHRCRWMVDVDDISSATGLLVAVDDDDDQVFDQSITNFRLIPVNEDNKGRPWTAIVVNPDSAIQPTTARDAVQVTALWGWAVVPSTIVEATIRQAARFFYRREAPFGVAGSPSTGSEIRLLAMVDPDVATMVRPYRRVWGAA